MKRYVALLRGIGPGNPNMRNNKLREVFERLGFSNVQTVISSGNVLFDTDISNTSSLEAIIEKALPEQLGFHSTAIVRSREQLQSLAAHNPFGGKKHSNTTYLFVTFSKFQLPTTITFPHTPPKKSYTILGAYDQEIYSIVDLTSDKIPNLMQWLEKQFGRKITSRTYKTVERIIQRLESE